MGHIEKSIEVKVPVRMAYNQWTQFEEFPRFMEGVEEVRQLDDRSLRWRAKIGGKLVEWTAAITEQTPDRIVSWRSTSGAHNSGTVTFRDLGNSQCRITLRLEYEPDGALEKAGSAIGVVASRVEGDLQRFKDFVESRATETGAWRGEIHGGQVTRDDPATGSSAASSSSTPSPKPDMSRQAGSGLGSQRSAEAGAASETQRSRTSPDRPDRPQQNPGRTS